MSESGSDPAAHQQRLEEEKFRVSQMKARLNFRSFRTTGSPREQLPSDADVAGHIGILVRNAFKGIQGPEKYARPKTKLLERREGEIGLAHNKIEAKEARKRLERLVAPRQLRLVRTLGWGGNGIASLFSYTRSKAVIDHFVAKHNISNTNYLDAHLLKEEERLQRVS
jgi:hypothetical protein